LKNIQIKKDDCDYSDLNTSSPSIRTSNSKTSFMQSHPNNQSKLD